jgi:hypothetical protein
MSLTTATAYRSGFTGQFAPARSRKSPENKPFYGFRRTFVRKAHCLKDTTKIGEACGSSGFMAWAKKQQ